MPNTNKNSISNIILPMAGLSMRFKKNDFATVKPLIKVDHQCILETKEELKRRIDAAAKYIPLEQICISPQCGFASTKEGNKLSEENQWRKLERLVDVADEVWG